VSRTKAVHLRSQAEAGSHPEVRLKHQHLWEVQNPADDIRKIMQIILPRGVHPNASAEPGPNKSTTHCFGGRAVRLRSAQHNHQLWGWSDLHGLHETMMLI